MILDKGICSIYKITNTAAPGDMPNETLVLIASCWYGELSFESSPIKFTESLEQVEIAQRIRIDRIDSIVNKTVVKIGTEQYYVERVYHGTDEDTNVPILDLNLSRVVNAYAII